MDIWKRRAALALSCALFLGSSLAVNAAGAEEISADAVTPPGRHVYEVTENSASDAWYGIARSDYLMAGIVQLVEEGRGLASCSGTTLAQTRSKRVFVRIYLDQSATAKLHDGSWHTLDYWTGEAFNALSATTQSGPYRVPTGQYYRVTGVHSVTAEVDRDGDGIPEDFTETTGTCTDALFFD